MQTTFPAFPLPSLESLIDYAPLTVGTEATIWDAITLMNQSQPVAQRIFVVENLRVVGLFSLENVLEVVKSEVDLKSSKITEAMRTSIIKVKYSHLEYTQLILNIFADLKGLPVVIEDEKEQLLGYIIPEKNRDFLFKIYKSKITQSEYSALEETHENKNIEALLFIKSSVESHSEAIMFTDLTGRVIDVNSSFINLFKYNREKLNELGGLSFLWNNTEEYEQILTSIKQGKFWHNSLEIRVENGDIFYTIVRIYPINDSMKKVIGMMSVYHINITEDIKLQQQLSLKVDESKKLEEELKQALEREKELNELKSRFISMTSHEFRTPLSTILSSSELLENYRHKWNEEKQIKHFNRINKAVKHMTNLLSDVLFFGKAEAGKIDCNPEKFDLVEYSRQLIEDIQINHNNKQKDGGNININFITNKDTLNCQIDEKVVGHILNNLLSNAVKYSLPETTVDFTLDSQKEKVVFEIKDEGIGIPSDDLPSLFDSFHRCKNVGNIPGTGLGLSITKKCVDMLNGEINVTSEIGVGTKFTITIPLSNCCNR